MLRSHVINLLLHHHYAHRTDVTALQVFGCDTASYFRGTAFRFPLRTAELASSSRISHQPYPPQKVRELLSALAAEAHLILLFLKCVEKIDILHCGEGDARPRLLFSCGVAGLGPKLREERALFFKAAAASAKPTGAGGNAAAGAALMATHRLELVSQHHGDGASWLAAEGGAAATASSTGTSSSSSRTRGDVNTTGSGAAGSGDPSAFTAGGGGGGGEGHGAAGSGPLHRTYLITQHKAGGWAAELAGDLSKQLGVPLVPWAAVAAEITAAAAEPGGISPDGQAFCFLPLPTKTGERRRLCYTIVFVFTAAVYVQCCFGSGNYAIAHSRAAHTCMCSKERC